MTNLLSIVVVLAVVYTRGAESLPTGAPAAACDDLTPRQNPQRTAGHASPAQSVPVPYIIDLSPFDDNGTLQYTPGENYTLTLSAGFPGPRSEDFRGFFIQARLAADGTTRVGSFRIVDTTNSRLSDCPIRTDGITHSNRNNKTSVSFMWTAPPRGTGGVVFRFAVVQLLNTFWADQPVPRTIAETETDMPTTATGETVMPTTAAARLTSASFWIILTVAFMGLALKAVV